MEQGTVRIDIIIEIRTRDGSPRGADDPRPGASERIEVLADIVGGHVERCGGISAHLQVKEGYLRERREAFFFLL